MNAMFATSVRIADAPPNPSPMNGREHTPHVLDGEEVESDDEEEDDCGILGDLAIHGPVPEITHIPDADFFIPNAIDGERPLPGDPDYEEGEEDELARMLQDSFRGKMRELFTRNGQTAPPFLQAALDQLFRGYTTPYAQRCPAAWAEWQVTLRGLYEQHVIMLKQAQVHARANAAAQTGN